jgi:hypothetical protein
MDRSHRWTAAQGWNSAQQGIGYSPRRDRHRCSYQGETVKAAAQAVRLPLRWPPSFSRLARLRRPFSFDLGGLICSVPIIGLQDPDKVGHAGPIPLVGHHRRLGVGRRLVCLPDPSQKIGDLLHAVYSAATLMGKRSTPPGELYSNPPTSFRSGRELFRFGVARSGNRGFPASEACFIVTTVPTSSL